MKEWRVRELGVVLEYLTVVEVLCGKAVHSDQDVSMSTSAIIADNGCQPFGTHSVWADDVPAKGGVNARLKQDWNMAVTLIDIPGCRKETQRSAVFGIVLYKGVAGVNRPQHPSREKSSYDVQKIIQRYIIYWWR